MLTAGLATVQPWLDIPELGTAIIVVTDGDPIGAAAIRDELAADVWARRRDYLPDLVDVEPAVREAFALHGEGLVVLSDSADATTSGAPGDSTWVLRELIKYDWMRPALVTLVAPEVVAEASKLGVGSRRIGQLGGMRDREHSTPIELEAEVTALFDAKFTLSGHLGRNLPIDMGVSAVLRRGPVHIVVTSRSGPHFAPELFQCAGLSPFDAAVLVAKSPCGFRAAYQSKARKILVVRAPGCAPSDFWRCEYRNIPRPLWPWDEVEVQ